MKILLGYAATFVATSLIGIALGANTGRIGHGWASPVKPQIEVNLNSSFFATTNNLYGSSLANQQLIETASGNANAPAYILSSSGVSTEVDQQGNIEEIAVVNPAEGSSSTSNHVDVNNLVTAAEDLEAHLIGANGVTAEVSGDTESHGGGEVLSAGETLNSLVSKINH